MHVFELFIQSNMKKSDSKKSSQRINGSNIVINGRSYVINGKISALYVMKKRNIRDAESSSAWQMDEKPVCWIKFSMTNGWETSMLNQVQQDKWMRAQQSAYALNPSMASIRMAKGTWLWANSYTRELSSSYLWSGFSKWRLREASISSETFRSAIMVMFP